MNPNVRSCSVCHRPLKNPESIKLGMGPICASKSPSPIDYSSVPVQSLPPLFDVTGLVCRRVAGQPLTNVGQRHKHHSPTGIEWGYGGSGPADLALNVLALVLPCQRDETDVKLWDGSKVSAAAWRLHHDFKRHFLAGMPSDGGRVSHADIDAWVQSRLTAGVEA